MEQQDSSQDLSQQEIPSVNVSWKPITQVVEQPICCQIDQQLSNILLKPAIQYKFDFASFQELPLIQITSHYKSSDMSGSWTVYTIQTFINNQLAYEAKHRYSEFELLRNILLQQFPTCIVPPIPEKHSLGDYAAKPTSAKDDPVVIERRKRLLSNFLNRIVNHQCLSRCHVFHLFLLGEKSMSDILVAEGIVLAKPTSGYMDKVSIKKNDPTFNSADDFTNRFAAYINHTCLLQRKLAQFHSEMQPILVQLGHLYNSWSLLESLPCGIDKVGEAFDAASMVQQRFANIYSGPIMDALIEYNLYSKSILNLLKWRYLKSGKQSVTQAKIAQKQAKLEALERSEQEALRIQAVLTNEVVSNKPTGIIATINSLIDQDPEQTRRKTISQLRDRIQQLQSELQVVSKDLELANGEIQLELNMFQQVKMQDFTSLFQELNRFMKQYHAKMRDIWLNCRK